jgi:outer membrane protein assembly factor BamA
MFGAAIPFGESSRVPYSRQFFLGGPSSMRGWNMRELGPGKLRPISGALFQLGDIRFETNLEYRFKFNSWIGGAFFADAGNIWLAKSVLYQETFLNQPYETGAFNSRFLEELAVDVGFGLRLDFTFFVFRFDVAFPVRNPSGFAIIDTNGLTQYVDGAGNQQFWKFDYSNANFLLAVGYPF